jgi:hypothetical protein
MEWIPEEATMELTERLQLFNLAENPCAVLRPFPTCRDDHLHHRPNEAMHAADQHHMSTMRKRRSLQRLMIAPEPDK